MSTRVVHRIREKQESLRRDAARENASQQGAAHLESLRRDAARRACGYEAREADYLSKILRAEDDIVAFHRDLKTAGGGRLPRALEAVRSRHCGITDDLCIFESRLASALRERGRDLRRATDARLHAPRTELAARKSGDDGLRAWREHAERLRGGLEAASAVCLKLKEVNAELLRQSSDVRTMLKVGEQDRQYLILQLVEVNKDTARCRHASERCQAKLADAAANVNKETPLARASAHLERDASKPPQGHVRAKRLAEVKNLEGILLHHQRNLLALRGKCATDAEESAALQRLLRARLLDLVQETRCDDTAPEDRRGALRAWQARALNLLYEKAFPASSTARWLPRKTTGPPKHLHPSDKPPFEEPASGAG
ncbi:hypothetical protein M885DRAFT_458358 [Pelagophyceae sp. CCMP2097]|nr:hypothetical protein M885DRAFT_458358 [Pelagophyceae sp. CCMP2097]